EIHLWNNKEGWSADYYRQNNKIRDLLTAAALFPLYVIAAATDRAGKVAAAAQAHLRQPGGLATTAVKSGQQWEA
ncbi:trehalase family glycosidase, partial [Salmonella enterica]|uniref:trehalase family glycosidase n=1 Tax=Salmonella enterica TaxID=28901 RepID=UPI003296D5DC